MADLTSLTGIIAVLVIGRVIYKLLVGNTSNTTPLQIPPAEMNATPAPQRIEEKPLSLWRRMHRSVSDRLFGRWIQSCELAVETTPKPYRMLIHLFCPRIVRYVDVTIPPFLALQLTGVHVYAPGNKEIEDWGLTYNETGEQTRIRIMLRRPEQMDRMNLEFGDVEGEYYWEVNSRVSASTYTDQEALFNAMRHGQLQEHDAARTCALEYLDHCQANPHIHLLLGRMLEHGIPAEDVKYHLNCAMALGIGDPSVGMYRELRASEPWLSDEERARLRGESAAWSMPSHHGVVTLFRRVEHTLGVHQWNVKRCVEVLEIRRAAAGRFMSKVGFSLDTGEVLIFTRARLIPAGGSPRELPLEQFTLREDPSNNPHITTLNDKTGTWLLPDFEVGDVLEWHFDTMRPEGQPIDGEVTHAFLFSSAGHPVYPTVRGQVVVQWRDPTDPCIHAGPVVSALSTKDESKDPWRSRTVSVSKYIPRHGVSSLYYHYELNPVVRCATVRQSWNDLGAAITNKAQGGLEPDDEIPEPLASTLATGGTPAEKLARAYHWVRDNLNYAAIESALGNIGQGKRAHAIVASGVADCKDRSYLLYLVSRSLGLAVQYVFVSIKHGFIFADTPADQFDHILVRARLDDTWVYMDATDSNGVFGSLPTSIQGMSGLACGDTCEIIDLPEDAPEFNGQELTETFDTINQDWLSGTIDMRLTGNVARMTDEAWKVDSLHQTDGDASAQNILENFAPHLRIDSHARIRETSSGSVFEVSGAHRRCQLVSLGKRRVGTLSWHHPILPDYRGRGIEHQGLFAFSMPFVMNLKTVLAGEPASRLRDVSPGEAYSSSIGSLMSETRREGDQVHLYRKVTIGRKFVRDQEMKELPVFFDALDRIMKAGLSFDG